MFGKLRSRLISARVRLLVLSVVTVVTFFVQPRSLPLELRSLVAWNGGVACFLGLALWMILTMDAEATRRHCSKQDDNWAVFDVLLLCASVASLAGIVAALIEASRAQGVLAFALTGTAILAVVLSWSLTHNFLRSTTRAFFTMKVTAGLIFTAMKCPTTAIFFTSP